jgi:predicted DNA-binding transcriptional regulator AlpA
VPHVKNESLNLSRHATILPDLSSSASPDQLVDGRAIAGLRACAVGTVRRDVADKNFPAPFKVGLRATRWRLAVVRAWIAAREAGVSAREATAWIESQSSGLSVADMRAWIASRQASSPSRRDAEPPALKAGRIRARYARQEPK